MAHARISRRLLIWGALVLAICAGVAAARAQTETPLILEGRLEPQQYASLSSARADRAGSVPIAVGDEVAAGQVLLVLEGANKAAAELAAAKLAVISARQAVEDLNRTADLARAQAGLALARAERALVFAEDHYTSLAGGESELNIRRTRANLRLLDEQIEQAQRDLEYFQKRFSNPEAPLRHFMNDRAFRLRIAELEGQVAELEGRRSATEERLEDMLAGPDEIDLTLAKTELELARVEFERAVQEFTDLLAGPDPDTLELAQANLLAAEARQRASQQAADDLVLRAPFTGRIVRVHIQPGEWVRPGVPLIVLADLNHWQVEISEIETEQVIAIQEGMCARVQPEAFPELSLPGSINHISDYYTLEDDNPLYSAQVECSCNDERLRWGLTVQVEVGRCAE